MTSPDRAEALLEPFLTDPRGAAVLTDFDGTLAEIVEDPAAARPLDAAPAVIARLAARMGRVWIVSGRPAAFLHAHFGRTGARLSGLYGLEWVEDGEVRAHPSAAPWRDAVETAAAAAEAELPATAGVERKGLSVTLHYRADPALEAVVRAWADATAGRSGLALHPARMSVELRPPVARDKGTAVAEAAAGMAAACFAGDDLGDLPAFDALDGLAAAGTHVLRIGVRSPEAPPELLDRADLVVDGPAGALALLERFSG